MDILQVDFWHPSCTLWLRNRWLRRFSHDTWCQNGFCATRPRNSTSNIHIAVGCLWNMSYSLRYLPCHPSGKEVPQTVLSQPLLWTFFDLWKFRAQVAVFPIKIFVFWMLHTQRSHYWFDFLMYSKNVSKWFLTLKTMQKLEASAEPQECRNLKVYNGKRKEVYSIQWYMLQYHVGPMG